MNFKRLLNTPMGRIFVSIILGLGLATLFRKVCNDKNCLVFNGPILADFEEKIYKHGDKCYKYDTNTDKCDSSKKVLDIYMPSKETEESKANMPKILTGAVPVASPPTSSSIFMPFSTSNKSA